jgi:hypothetical protein
MGKIQLAVDFRIRQLYSLYSSCAMYFAKLLNLLWFDSIFASTHNRTDSVFLCCFQEQSTDTRLVIFSSTVRQAKNACQSLSLADL